MSERSASARAPIEHSGKYACRRRGDASILNKDRLRHSETDVPGTMAKCEAEDMQRVDTLAAFCIAARQHVTASNHERVHVT